MKTSALYNWGRDEVPALGIKVIRMKLVLRLHNSLCFSICMVNCWVSDERPSNVGIPRKTVCMSRIGELLNRKMQGWLDLDITSPLVEMTSAVNWNSRSSVKDLNAVRTKRQYKKAKILRRNLISYVFNRNQNTIKIAKSQVKPYGRTVGNRQFSTGNSISCWHLGFKILPKLKIEEGRDIYQSLQLLDCNPEKNLNTWEFQIFHYRDTSQRT